MTDYTYLFSLSIGYPNATRSERVYLTDYFDEEEIETAIKDGTIETLLDEALSDWAINYIETSATPV